MKITFRRDVLANYMVIENTPSFCPEDFSVKMLEYNNIGGLLKFSYENINGKVNLLYDISSKQAILALFETEKITYERLEGFVLSLKSLVQNLEGYLLDVNNIILKKECIFTDLNPGKYSYCYDPYYNGDLCMELGILFDELLNEVNYEDAKAVKLIYDLNRECHRKNFTLESLCSVLQPEESEKKPEEKEAMIPDISDRPFYSDKEENPEIKMSTHEEFSNKRKENSFAASDEVPSSGFFKKLSFYLKGKSVYEVVEDIDSGQIKNKIKESAPLGASSGKKTKNKPSEYDFKATAFNEASSMGCDMPSDNLVFEEVKLGPFENQDSFMETSLLSKEEPGHCLVGRNLQQGKIMQIDEYPYTIGKLKDKVNGVSSSSAVSRIHCRIYEDSLEEGDYFFEDLNSKNGSYINNIRVNPYKKMPLRPGDIVKIADEEYVFR